MNVVDACVAVKWFLQESQSEAADAFLSDTHVRVAPEHILVEIGNALLRAVRGRAITEAHAAEALELLGRLVHLHPIRDVASDALRIAGAVGCTHYDALYVAVAERWEAPLLTVDGPLTRQLRAVHWKGRIVGL